MYRALFLKQTYGLYHDRCYRGMFTFGYKGGKGFKVFLINSLAKYDWVTTLEKSNFRMSTLTYISIKYICRYFVVS